MLVCQATARGGKQKHFLLVTLKNGQVQVVLKAKRKLELTSARGFSDGAWHHVSHLFHINIRFYYQLKLV